MEMDSSGLKMDSVSRLFFLALTFVTDTGLFMGNVLSFRLPFLQQGLESCLGPSEGGWCGICRGHISHGDSEF